MSTRLEKMFSPDFCEKHCPVCTRARSGSTLARAFMAIEMLITFGGCPWGRARQRVYGVRPDEPVKQQQKGTVPGISCP